jgi:diguanylate cyclase (GGDEF)-like protein/PAS domain S-box-containing protein
MTKALGAPTDVDVPRSASPSRPLIGTVVYLTVGALWLAALDRLAGLAAWPLLLFSTILVYLLLKRAAAGGAQAAMTADATLDDLADMVVVVDPARRIRGWNHAAARMAGFDRLWLGRRLEDAFASADSAAVAAGLPQADAATPCEFEARLVGAVGAVLLCRWTVAATDRGWVLSGRPVPPVSRGAADRERLLRQMIDGVGQLVAVVVDGEVVFVNQAGAALLGAATPDQVIGIAWGDLCPQQRAAAPVPLRRRDGSTLDVEINTIPVVYDGRAATLLLGRDTTELSRATQALDDSEGRLQSVLDLVGEAVLTVDQDGLVRSFNPTAERVFGYARHEVIGQPMALLLPRDRQTRHSQALAGYAASAHPQPIERRVPALRKDGKEFPVEVAVTETRSRDGRLFTTVVRDLTERRRIESRLLIAEKVLECTIEGVMVTDPRGNIQWVNAAFCKISGYGHDEVIGQNAGLLKSGQGSDFYRTMWQQLRAVGHWEGEIWNRRKDGETYLEWLNIRAVTDEAGVVTQYVGVFSDISRHKRAEETIKHLTYYDGVTRLPNRYLFRDRVGQALERAHRSNRMVALVLVGLDRFKQVNETLGHATGDALLREVAERLLRSVRGQDTVARLRGDTFCCVLTDLTHGQDATPVVNRVLESFTPSFLLNGHELFATSSLGISIFPVDGPDVDDLVQKAETAMNRSKDKAESTYHFYTPEMNANSMERLRLETDLRKAITQNDLVLFYQPKVDAETGRMVGSEALVRWQHAELGMIPPGKFIPIAEETGLILPIGKWVLKEACRQIREWQNQGLTVSRVAVNLSAHQFRQPDLVETVVRVLAETAVDPDLIELELTESAVMHNAEIAVRRMLDLHDAGIRIAIDDFGTGYSSLSHLKRFPLDKLKIDRSFIQDLGSSPAGEEIVGAIVAMAHSLNLTVVAEGVEKAAQLELLRRLRCDEIQGYYFSPPVPAARFAEFLQAGVLVGQEVV